MKRLIIIFLEWQLQGQSEISNIVLCHRKFMSVVKNRFIRPVHLPHTTQNIQAGRLLGTSTTSEQLTLKNREIRKFVIWQEGRSIIGTKWWWVEDQVQPSNLVFFWSNKCCFQLYILGVGRHHTRVITKHQQETKWTSLRQWQTTFWWCESKNFKNW